MQAEASKLSAKTETQNRLMQNVVDGTDIKTDRLDAIIPKFEELLHRTDIKGVAPPAVELLLTESKAANITEESGLRSSVAEEERPSVTEAHAARPVQRYDRNELMLVRASSHLPRVDAKDKEKLSDLGIDKGQQPVAQPRSKAQKQLSSPAIHCILQLLYDDYRRTYGLSSWGDLKELDQLANGVSRKWRFIYDLYFIRGAHSPPHDFLRSLELALYLDHHHDVRDVFKHEKPMTFRQYIPHQIIQKIIEAFQQLTEEPSFLDVTVDVLPVFTSWEEPKETLLVDLWSEAYVTHVCCKACTAVESIVIEKPDVVGVCHDFRRTIQQTHTAHYVVEKFHVPSKRFDKQLLVELHYEFDEKKLHKATIHLVQGSCCPRERVRTSESLLLCVADLVCDVYAFLGRAQVGTSLTANGRLSALILHHRSRLPLHLLCCCTRKSSDSIYSVSVFCKRPKYDTEKHEFELYAADCNLILCQLSNSITHFAASEGAYRFTVRLLAALTAHNVSVSGLRLRTFEEKMSDYCSMEAIFGSRGLRTTVLDLSMDEHDCSHIIKTTDFLRTPTVQRLDVLALTLRDNAKPSRRDAMINPPLWVDGIHVLASRSLYEVIMPFHRSEAAAIRLVHVCEKFERGAITDTVEHFILKARGSWTFPFKDANLAVSGVETNRMKDRHYTWDVHRFRNAFTGDWLTACVGLYRNRDQASYASLPHTVLRILKGEAVPDDSFAVNFPCDYELSRL